jgi:transcriptional antiterminator RfaH
MQCTLDICSWYAIHTKPLQEMRAESNLTCLGIETYLPKFKECHHEQYDSRGAGIIKPLFPRYFFARFTFNTLGHKVRYTRGVRDVVGFGKTPIPIDDEIIKLVQSKHDGLGYIRLERNLNPRGEIIVYDDTCVDLHGIFEQNVSSSARVMILLKAIQSQAYLWSFKA